MAVFTALSRAEVNEFLGQFSLGELTELEGIHTGIENTNYFVTTDRGHYVLTVFERLTARQLPFYLQLMLHLAHKRIAGARAAADPQRSIGRRVEGQTCGADYAFAGQGDDRADRRAMRERRRISGAHALWPALISRRFSRTCAASVGGKARCPS